MNLSKCNTCDDRTSISTEYPCSICKQESMHSDHRFPDSDRLARLRAQGFTEKKPMKLGQLLATWCIGWAMVYLLLHILVMFFGRPA